jgi:hypothetical protein
MATLAGSSSGGGFDVAALTAIVRTTMQHVEVSWGGEYRVSPAGQRAVLTFAENYLKSFADRDLPPAIDLGLLADQIAALTKEFLEDTRSDAEAAGTVIRGPSGIRELPLALITTRVEPFVSARCWCWPQ